MDNVQNCDSYKHILVLCFVQHKVNYYDRMSRKYGPSQSHITTDGQSVVCQGIEPILGLVTIYYFLSEGLFSQICCLISVGGPL
jgi:hypothetical protein